MFQKSRLEVGVDVPWVTSWSAEAILGARPCATVGGRLAIAQQERPGYGKPNYSQNHARRQRQCVCDMLCPMCGRATEPNDRWIQTASLVPAGELRRRGFAAALPASVADRTVIFNAGSITPSHHACATRALEHCPHLRGYSNPTLLAFPERWTTYPLMVGPAATHVLAITPPPPAILFLQLFGIADEA